MSDSWVRVAEFSLDDNLSSLDRRLSNLHIVHRFTEGDGVQHLWVSSRHDLDDIELILEDKSIDIDLSPRPLFSRIDLSTLFSCPFTVLLLLLGTIGYLSESLNLYSVLNKLVFLPFDQMVAEAEYWRLVTPAFIHFGIMHLVFNALWIWVVGKRLEDFMGWQIYLLLFVFSAVVSNVFQYTAVKQIGFGGLSGVVYAFFGCIFVLHKKYPINNLAMPAGIFAFMLFWLILGFSGVIDNFIQGQIANWAHLGGLLAGIVFGFCYSFLVKKK